MMNEKQREMTREKLERLQGLRDQLKVSGRSQLADRIRLASLEETIFSLSEEMVRTDP